MQTITLSNQQTILFYYKTCRSYYCLMLLFILLLIIKCSLCLEIDGHNIKDMLDHRYHEDIKGDVTVREYLLQETHPRSPLLCPKGFAISRLTMKLYLSEDIVKTVSDEFFNVPYAHWILKEEHLDGVSSDEEHGHSKCPTLQKCLGYQACLFNFGNEFCRMDVIPGQRKNLNLNVTCTRNNRLFDIMKEVKYDTEIIKSVKRKTNKILHMTYISQLEEGVQDYSSTVITDREMNEDLVFHGTCPNLVTAATVGYRGSCVNNPPDPVHVSESLWSLLGRVPQERCREELQQIFCSFQYHKKGLCLPPYAVEPGQDTDTPTEKLLLSDASMSKPGHRPSIDPVTRINNHPTPELIPVKLGFLILAHKDHESLMQLIKLIYRPHHYYAIHIEARRADTRMRLLNQLAEDMPRADNIRVLPANRSFIASWGSWGIVRAEIEVFEELLRMGMWDFGVKLSGADMPIRNVDDLAATLAPYRNTSFVPLFGQRNKDMKADQGLVWDVWHGCQGYVYNVTRGDGQPHPHEIKIYTGSQWSLMNRAVIEYAVTPHLRNIISNKWHYHIQISIIPDECYFPTAAMNSPYKDNCHNLGFTWLKHFEGRNTLNLCRHMEDTDFCGQGPAPIETGDWNNILESSHRYFFARKFHTDNPNHNTRLLVKNHALFGYYEQITKHTPKALIEQLIELSWARVKLEIAKEPSLKDKTLSLGTFLDFKILPRLHLVNPCCSLPFERSFKSTQEFLYWIEYSILDESTFVVSKARVSLVPTPACNCYPDGHLRALRFTTWPAGHDLKHRVPESVNMPLPFAMPGTETVYIEMWFHAGNRSITEECKKQPTQAGTPMTFQNLNVEKITSEPMNVKVQIVDPKGNVRCEELKTEKWTSEHVHTNRDNERIEMASFFTVSCGTLEPGLWTIRAFQRDVPQARQYEIKFPVLPDPAKKDGESPDMLMGAYTVQSATLLPLPDFYGEDNMADKSVEDDDYTPDRVRSDLSDDYVEHRRHIKDFSGRHIKSRVTSLKRSPAVTTILSVLDWLACSGGLLTTMLMCIFTYHWLLLPSFYGSKMTARMKTSAYIVIVTLVLQSTLCAFHCCL